MQKLDIFYYICTMKTTDIIKQRIKAIGDGVAFDYSDILLPGDMQMATAKILSRMVADGELKKIAKGKFYKPVETELGEMPLMIEQLTKDLIYRDGVLIGYITGVPAFAQLGLTTQISSKILIGSATYRRPMKRGGYDISYIKQSNEITEDGIKYLKMLDALRFIKSIPATTPDNVVAIMRKQLSGLKKDEWNLLCSYALNYPAATKALLGAILEANGYFSEDLKSSLNVFTKYDLGVSDSVLTNKNNWNIR